jgi:cytidine deaminase
MGERHEHIFIYRRSPTSDLSLADQDLVERAKQSAARAYAPYSRFFVGAALRKADGDVVEGNNQENASFPAGICAERAALHYAMAIDPKAVVEVIAVAVPQVKGDAPVSPCGICRQALLEQETRQGAPLRILLAASSGSVIEVSRAADLLPLHFDASFLPK